MPRKRARSPEDLISEQGGILKAVDAKLAGLSEKRRKALATVVHNKDRDYPKGRARQTALWKQQHGEDQKSLRKLITRTHEFLCHIFEGNEKAVWDPSEFEASAMAWWTKAAYGSIPGLSWGLELDPEDDYAHVIELLRTRYKLSPIEMALWAWHTTGRELPINEAWVETLATRIRTMTYSTKPRATARTRPSKRRA